MSRLTNDPEPRAVVPLSDVERSTHPSLPFLQQEAERYLGRAISANTWKAYRTDWRDFEAWCLERSLTPMPAQPDTVVAYITHLASEEHRVVATILRKLSSISVAHGTRGHASPTKTERVHKTLQGIKNTLGTAQTKKQPIVTDELQLLVATCAALHPRAAARDRALLLLGFGGGMRRSEIAALTVEDITAVREGLDVVIRTSKTDQEGRGETISIAYGSHPETCPVRTLGDWLALSGITSGPLFREIDRHGNVGAAPLHPASVARIIQRACRLAGLEPATRGGHSLRSGMATSAAARGSTERSIMRQGRWRSRATLDVYVRYATRWQDNASTNLGL